MKNRQFSALAEKHPTVKGLLDRLVSDASNVDGYRATMVELGRHLAKDFVQELQALNRDICVVCTVEDADFLARGVLAELELAGLATKTHLLCLWNDKVREGSVSLSPISRKYEEPFASNDVVYVIVKSIISGACVVKTNITRALSSDKTNENDVFVVSPVLYNGAQKRLEHEFPLSIAKKFRYVFFATDFDKDKSGEVVLPGIGGSVYELLGLGDEHSKNGYVPSIVKERRLKKFKKTPAFV